MRNTTENQPPRTQPDAVEQFTDCLGDFDLDDWLAVAAAAEVDAPIRSTATALLEALIAHLGLGVQAWSIRDDVETVASCLVNQSTRAASRRQALTRLRAARAAANAAALALLLRPLLLPDDFDVLVRPFTHLVPL